MAAAGAAAAKASLLKQGRVRAPRGAARNPRGHRGHSFGGQPRRPLCDLGLRGEAGVGWGVARPHPLLVPRARVPDERRRARRRWLRRGLLRLSLPPLATAPLRASALALPLGGGRGRAGGGGWGRGGVAAVEGAAGVWPGGRRGTMAGPDGAESGRVGGVGGVGGGRSRFCRGLGDAPRQGAAEWRRGREPRKVAGVLEVEGALPVLCPFAKTARLALGGGRGPRTRRGERGGLRVVRNCHGGSAAPGRARVAAPQRNA